MIFRSVFPDVSETEKQTFPGAKLWSLTFMFSGYDIILQSSLEIPTDRTGTRETSPTSLFSEKVK